MKEEIAITSTMEGIIEPTEYQLFDLHHPVTAFTYTHFEQIVCVNAIVCAFFVCVDQLG